MAHWPRVRLTALLAAEAISSRLESTRTLERAKSGEIAGRQSLSCRTESRNKVGKVFRKKREKQQRDDREKKKKETAGREG